MTSPSLMHETGHSKPVHWDNPEGWDGEGGGGRSSGHVHLWLIHISVISTSLVNKTFNTFKMRTVLILLNYFE